MVEVIRKSIKLPRVALDEEIKRLTKEAIGKFKEKNLKCINIRGSNGAGKSTIPIRMLFEDKKAYILTDKGKDVATVLPQLGYALLGTYRNKTGGGDTSTFQDKEYTKEILRKLWVTPYNVLFESMTISASFTFWAQVFGEFSYDLAFTNRQIGVMSIIIPLEVNEQRIKKRNGGKDINMKYVAGKLRTVTNNVEKFTAIGVKSWAVDNTSVSLDEVYDWFHEQVNENMEGLG